MIVLRHVSTYNNDRLHHTPFLAVGHPSCLRPLSCLLYLSALHRIDSGQQHHRRLSIVGIKPGYQTNCNSTPFRIISIQLSCPLTHNMLFSSLVTLALASIASADPSDKSGKSQMTFKCTGVTLPDPVGGGGYGIFTDDLSFWPEGQDGPEIKPTACTEIDSFCNNCLIEYDQLSSATNVTACWNP